MLTSLACAFLLARAWRRTRTALLLWTAACFGLLAINNVLLVIDLLIFPQNDLSLARQVTALGAVGVLLYGFVRETA
ncbi:MAG: hypothetical protein JSR45_17370 [Proteobacteria bacterium]|nr:hypothetical protein [Pseudomonadota bacterium]